MPFESRREGSVTDFKGPKRLVYMPDTNVIAMMVDGHEIVVPEVHGMMSRGVKFIVPARTMTEIKNDPDPVRRGFQLALIRDLGWEVQTGPTPTALTGGGITPPIREEFLKKHPFLRGKPVSDDTIRKYIWDHPEFVRTISKQQSNVQNKDVPYILDVRRQAAVEGPGSEVNALSYQRVGGKLNPNEHVIATPGVNYGNSGQKERIYKDYGVKLAPESRALDRKERFSQLSLPEHLWEISSKLRPQQVSRKVFEPNGALGRPTTPPRMPSTPKGSLRFRGTFGNGLKAVGGLFLEIIIVIILNWLMKPLIEKWNRELIDKELKEEVNPKMIGEIHSRREQALDLLAQGQKAFAKVVIRYLRQDPADGPLPDDLYLHVQFWQLISIVSQKMDKPEKKEFRFETEKGAPSSGNPVLNNQLGILTYSGERVTDTVEITYSEEEVELFKNYRAILTFCMSQFLSCEADEGGLNGAAATAAKRYLEANARALCQSI